MDALQFFSTRAFWDVDPADLKLDEHGDFLIEKIFNRGTWDDMKKCVTIYGNEKIIKALTNARYLRPEVRQLVSVLFQIPENEFRCCKVEAQMSLHSDY